MSVAKRSRLLGGKKGGTAPLRKHHFESFNQRISKLNIDPVRRVRRQYAGEEDSDLAKSYFRDALLHWRDINLSESFTRFVRDVEPLCDSLHQVLHHRSKLVELLHQHLERRETISLEPLLALLAQLARDLGARFEDYFPTSLALVLSIASGHEDVEAIEWSFSCLAWLFKYLSRLLVPDLRPTYDIVAAVLGKENHKAFLARFAAEAISFLIRKAAAVSHKDRSPLETITRHVLLDLSSARGFGDGAEVYLYGVMSLFASSIKGVDRGLHSCGVTIYQCILNLAADCGVSEVIHGVTVNIMHHTDETTFAPVLEIVCNSTMQIEDTSSATRLEQLSSLLFILSTVRKGSRVSNWKPLLSSLESLLEHLAGLQSFSNSEVASALGKAAAVIFAAAPLDTVLLHRRILDKLARETPAASFLVFCINFSKLHRERFGQFAKHLFFECLASHWSKLEDELLYVACSISEDKSRVLSRKEGPKYLCPQAWQEKISLAFEARCYATEDMPRLQGYLHMMSLLEFEQAQEARILGSLRDRIQSHVDTDRVLDDECKFLFGEGLALLLRIQRNTTTLRWSEMINVIRTVGRMPRFLENLSTIQDSVDTDSGRQEVDTVIAVLIRNLSSSSKALRRDSLILLISLFRKTQGIEPDILNVMLAIEDLPFTMQSARTASMYVRQLSSAYQRWASNMWIVRAIPRFCFGLLHYHVSQVWDDAIETMKCIVSYPAGEEEITEIVFSWLEDPLPTEPESRSQEQQPARARMNEFRCSNSAHVDEMMSTEYERVANAYQRLRRQFDSSHTVGASYTSSCRTQALRVLAGIPALAEKRSRRLVPLFLGSVASQRQVGMDNEAYVDAEEETRVVARGKDCFSRSELKTMLNVFGSFANPAVLYRATEVHDALLNLLAVGDAQIQKAALKALFTWKTKALEAYKENLLNLLDDTRFKDEITIFVRSDDIEALPENTTKSATIPYLLRILYGRIIARQGASGSSTLSSKRRCVFDALATFPNDAISEFILIALGPLQFVESINPEVVLNKPEGASLSQRQQLGLFNVIYDMLDTMGERLTFCLPLLLRALLFCSQQGSEDTESTPMAGKPESVSAIQSKALRKVGMRCLLLLFTRFSSSELQEYVPLIFKIFVSPRLGNLAGETGQSVSGILELFSSWAASLDTVFYLIDHESRVLPSLVSILESSSAKDLVKVFVLDQIFRPIALHGNAEEAEHSTIKRSIRGTILMPFSQSVLTAVGSMLRKDPSKQILASSLEAFSLLSQFTNGAEQVRGLLELNSFLLQQPAHKISPKLKGNIVEALIYFIPLSDLNPTDDIFDDLCQSVSLLFGYFKDRENRTRLANAFEMLSNIDPDLQEVAQLCINLNSFSSSSIDAPDFDRRFEAFQALDAQAKEFSARQWEPIVHNMLFYIQDAEELTIRTSASHCLKQFVSLCGPSSSQSQTSLDGLKKQLLASLRKGVSNSSELIRAEYLSVFAELLRRNADWDEVKDLTPLLMKDDEEASFFTNILHIQQHRRLRALRRLALEARKCQFKSASVAHFLIPLLEQFIIDTAGDSSTHNLTSETVTTIGALAYCLEWPQLRALFCRYTAQLVDGLESEKPKVRLLSTFAEAMNNATSPQASYSDPSSPDQKIISDESALVATTTLSRTMPKQEKLSNDIRSNLLRSLQNYVHHKDETVVSQRMPVAIVIVKLLRLLQSERFPECLPSVLTDVCQVLRSRSQESRDLTRKTLAEVSQIIGSKYFNFILKELRSALPRGYQLHVLSFTIHSILIANDRSFLPGDLDYCLPELVAVMMEDIFGTTGQEKEAEDYTSKMKEVKSNKSFDSMELIAKITSMTKVGHLLHPLDNLLEERLDLRTLKKVDEVLRRIGVGLLHNDRVGSTEGLILCYEMLQQVFGGRTTTESVPGSDRRLQRLTINLRRSNKSATSSKAASHRFKLARFALDLLRTIVNKYDNLKTSSHLAGFVPIISEALLSPYEEVQVSSMRLLASILKVPLREVDSNAPVYLAESMKTIKAATSTNIETAQAALKLITGILRERPEVDIRSTDLAYLLLKMKSDLEEPDRQGITFNFLKAVLQRKILIPEVYNIMDSVSGMMITNQSKGARDMARGLYVQFFLNYPQTKDRLKKQLAFLLTNLDYQHIEGRQSVMEVIHQLLEGAGEIVAQTIIGSFFAPLVLVTANDESRDCRHMASTLLKSLLGRADNERLSNALGLVQSWVSQDEQGLLLRIGLQTYITFFESHPKRGIRELPLVQERLRDILQTELSQRYSDEWDILYISLQLFTKLLQLYPQQVFEAESASIWDSVQQASAYPHAWIKLASSKLLGSYFSDIARANAGRERLMPPLQGSGGLELSLDRMSEITRTSLRSLKVTGVNEELANQLIKNLGFLGRLYGSMEDRGYVEPQAYTLDEIDQAVEEDREDQEEEGGPSGESFAEDAPLSKIFRHLSIILRRDPDSLKTAALVPKAAAIQLLALLCGQLPEPCLLARITAILHPLQQLTDPLVTAPSSFDEGFGATYDKIVSSAHDTVSLLQKKLGAPVVLKTMAEVKKAVDERRNERRVKRKIEAVANPEKAGLKRGKKHARVKLKRKERSAEHRSKRRGW